MATTINTSSWDQGKAGIQLETLIYELDRLLVQRRMSVQQAERYILTHIVKDQMSTLNIKVNEQLQDAIVITYLDDPIEVSFIGFTVPIASLYTLWCKLKRERSNVKTTT